MTEKPLTRLQMDLVFHTVIMVCEDCWYRAKSIEQAELHIKVTGHKGFHSKKPWELPYVDYKKK
jgi:hypothetical protein